MKLAPEENTYMAKEKNGSGTGTGTGTTRADDGFVRVGSVANAPWFELKKGNRLVGVLQNVYERPDERTPTGKSKFFQIELLEDAPCRYGRGEDAKVNVAKAGTTVNVNWGPKTNVLERYIPDIIRGAIYHVRLTVGDRFPISKGRKMWDITPEIKLVRGPRPIEDDVDFGGDDGAETEAAAG